MPQPAPHTLTGARAIAKVLEAVSGQPVSVWSVYRLSARPGSPIRTHPLNHRLVADRAALESWWIAAKGLADG